MATNEMHTTSLRLSNEEYQALRTYAFLSDRSINDVIRGAVREYLTGAGRRDAVQAAITTVRKEHRKALDVLADR